MKGDFMDVKSMEKKIKELQKKVAVLEDLEAIKRLQRTYGYYLEHWMYEEIIDLFSDRPDTKLNIMVGIFLGKEGVRRYFSGEKARGADPEMLHQIMQLSGVVDIAPDGKTAAGRWYGFGAVALPAGKGVLQNLTAGIYTVEYIKEDGKWKIWKIMWNPEIMADTTVGWVKPERLAKVGPEKLPAPPRPDKPRDVNSRYPSGYIPPFHYAHPVTGKPTSERKHNKALKIKGAK
jgi:hypothetical protein